MDLALISLLTLVSSIIGTAAGFGASLIMIPVLAFFLPPGQVIFLTAIVHTTGCLWRVMLFHKVDMRLFLWFAVPGLVASYAGALAAQSLDPQLLKRFLGAFLVLFAVSQLAKLAPAWKNSTSTAAVGGVAQGFCAGLFGIGGPVRSAALLAFKLPKEAYIATGGAIGLVTDSTRIVTYVAAGEGLPQRLWLGLLLFLPMSLLGAWAARWFVRRVPAEKFLTGVSVFLLGVGALMALAPGLMR